MQTFLPYANFIESAACLDNKRLGKQRVEAWQIYLALTQEDYGWKNHPAVLMWEGRLTSLLFYGLVVCDEWIKRGFNDSLRDRFKVNLGFNKELYGHPFPAWFGDDRFHSSHKSNLLRKDYNYYIVFGWDESNDQPYFWPTKEGY